MKRAREANRACRISPDFFERDKERLINILRGVIYSVMRVALFSGIVIQLTVPGAGNVWLIVLSVLLPSVWGLWDLSKGRVGWEMNSW